MLKVQPMGFTETGSPLVRVEVFDSVVIYFARGPVVAYSQTSAGAQVCIYCSELIPPQDKKTMEIVSSLSGLSKDDLPKDDFLDSLKMVLDRAALAYAQTVLNKRFHIKKGRTR